MKVRLEGGWGLILVTSSEFKLVLLYRKCICIQIVSRYGGQRWTTFTGFLPLNFYFLPDEFLCDSNAWNGLINIVDARLFYII